MATPPKNDKDKQKAAGAKPTLVPKVVKPTDDVDATTLKKKEFMERVAQLSDRKVQDIKPTVEAMLKIMGDALAAGDNLAVPPLGNIRINRRKDTAGGEVLILKLRRANPGINAGKAKPKSGGKAGKAPLADEDD